MKNLSINSFIADRTNEKKKFSLRTIKKLLRSLLMLAANWGIWVVRGRLLIGEKVDDKRQASRRKSLRKEFWWDVEYLRLIFKLRHSKMVHIKVSSIFFQTSENVADTKLQIAFSQFSFIFLFVGKIHFKLAQSWWGKQLNLRVYYKLIKLLWQKVDVLNQVLNSRLLRKKIYQNPGLVIENLIQPFILKFGFSGQIESDQKAFSEPSTVFNPHLQAKPTLLLSFSSPEIFQFHRKQITRVFFDFCDQSSPWSWLTLANDSREAWKQR